MFDKETHRFFIFAKFLQKSLPKDNGGGIQLDDELMLEYYRLEKAYSGSIELEKTTGKVKPIKGDTGANADKKETLSQLLKKINERFSTSFTALDKVMEQFEADFLADEELVKFAKNNDKATFKHIYEKEFNNIAAKRYVQNDEFFIKMFEDEAFLKYIMAEMFSGVYEKLRGKK